MFICTERLFLRPGWPDDLDDFLALLDQEPDALGRSTVRLPHGAQAARQAISDLGKGHLPSFFIDLRTNGGLKLIGGVGLSRRDPDADPELQFWIARAYRSHGFGSEAVRALLQHAWMLGHSRLLAFQFANSDADHRVLISAGFALTGGSCMRYSERDGCEVAALVYAADRPEMPAYGPIGAAQAA